MLRSSRVLVALLLLALPSRNRTGSPAAISVGYFWKDAPLTAYIKLHAISRSQNEKAALAACRTYESQLRKLHVKVVVVEVVGDAANPMLSFFVTTSQSYVYSEARGGHYAPTDDGKLVDAAAAAGL